MIGCRVNECGRKAQNDQRSDAKDAKGEESE